MGHQNLMWSLFTMMTIHVKLEPIRDCVVFEQEQCNAANIKSNVNIHFSFNAIVQWICQHKRKYTYFWLMMMNWHWNMLNNFLKNHFFNRYVSHDFFNNWEWLWSMDKIDVVITHLLLWKEIKLIQRRRKKKSCSNYLWNNFFHYFFHWIGLR